jgi:hypothetical protein
MSSRSRQTQFARCPECDELVHLSHFENHIDRIHRSQQSNSSILQIKQSESSVRLTHNKVKHFSCLISTWLYKYREGEAYNRVNLTILTIKAIDEFMGYGLAEINVFLDREVNEDSYARGIKRLSLVYERMVAQLREKLHTVGKNNVALLGLWG